MIRTIEQALAATPAIQSIIVIMMLRIKSEIHTSSGQFIYALKLPCTFTASCFCVCLYPAKQLFSLPIFSQIHPAPVPFHPAYFFPPYPSLPCLSCRQREIIQYSYILFTETIRSNYNTSNGKWKVLIQYAATP